MISQIGRSGEKRKCDGVTTSTDVIIVVDVMRGHKNVETIVLSEMSTFDLYVSMMDDDSWMTNNKSNHNDHDDDDDESVNQIQSNKRHIKKGMSLMLGEEDDDERDDCVS